MSAEPTSSSRMGQKHNTEDVRWLNHTTPQCRIFSRAFIKEDIERYYYLDIAKCLDSDADRVDAVSSVPADKTVREDFGRRIVLNLSERDGEFTARLFPLNTVYDAAEANAWKNGYRKFHGYDEDIISRLDQFDEQVLMPIIKYTLPVIQLDKTTPKEAVCQVFENVNTGRVPLQPHLRHNGAAGHCGQQLYVGGGQTRQRQSGALLHRAGY